MTLDNIVLACNKPAGYDVFRYLLDKNTNITSIMTDDNIIKDLAQLFKIPVNNNYNGNVLFSVYYNKKVPKIVLDKMDIAINFHGGKLPEYAGCNSNIWSIINNEPRGTSTAHLMTDKFDVGDIVEEKHYPITNIDTGISVYKKGSAATVDLFKKVFENYKSLNFKPQIGIRNYYSKQLPYDGYINPGWMPEFTERFVRALHFPPYTPAKLKYGNRELLVYSGIITNNKYRPLEVKLQ